ncbi:BTB/POZ and MATH domain-containing protein 1-like [Triticum dicoccoides]|uniref:BTB/POZ and MATH domain-containing protein 1-like n=1 Tax=Triticum dicoccoides TaxID=85692 RepID=UPI000E791177|nr:BTB/POZ and MATH domain-containing protein 1-like [Triticum dicoccoides]
MSKGITRTPVLPASTTTTCVDSASIHFRVDYEQVKNLGIDEVVCSELLTVGQHLWRIDCYPRGPVGYSKDDMGNYVSIYLKHMSDSESVRATFIAFIKDRDDKPTEIRLKTYLHDFTIMGAPDHLDDWGWNRFVPRKDLEETYLIDGHVTFVCTIMVTRDTTPVVTVPPSDIKNHLGCLLDHAHAYGTDVSFTVHGETFPVNRAILAARSPVFKAELFGSMAEATMASITLHDITPSTFKRMLRFIYTDEFPTTTTEDNTSNSNEVLFDLLAAADRYALDRLKLMCVQKLWDNVSMDTVTDIQACADMYNCLELKDKCIDFVAKEKKSKKPLVSKTIRRSPRLHQAKAQIS